MILVEMTRSAVKVNVCFSVCFGFDCYLMGDYRRRGEVTIEVCRVHRSKERRRRHSLSHLLLWMTVLVTLIEMTFAAQYC